MGGTWLCLTYLQYECNRNTVVINIGGVECKLFCTAPSHACLLEGNFSHSTFLKLYNLYVIISFSALSIVTSMVATNKHRRVPTPTSSLICLSFCPHLRSWNSHPHHPAILLRVVQLVLASSLCHKQPYPPPSTQMP